MPRTLEQKAAVERASRARLRAEIIRQYGSACSCCGEDTDRFLTIDHTESNGADHRRSIGGAHLLYRWIKAQGFPSTFRVLCTSCNAGRHINKGTCPHQGPVVEPVTREQRYRRKLKAEVIDGYGGRCVCCGETEKTFLTVDHLLQSGNAHRRELGNQTGPVAIYRLLRNLRFPKGYQILCFNCNTAKHFSGGACPHGVILPYEPVPPEDAPSETTDAP